MKQLENKTIQEWFEEQVEWTPNNIAVVCEDRRLTYNELNQKANQLARHLKSTYTVFADDLIVLCMDRSEHMLVAILAVLKAGCAYVPIEPSYPDERIGYVLEDTRSKAIITNVFYQEKLQFILNERNKNHSTILVIDDESLQNELIKQPTINVKSTNTSHHLAYVMYTSGTTGRPNGVMVEHHSVINYLANIQSLNVINQEDIVDFSTSIAFDLTVTTTIVALCIGATVAVYSGILNDLDSYITHLSNNQINIIKSVPSYFELLMVFLPMTQIKRVILGGEKLSTKTISRLNDIYKNHVDAIPEICDEYGPTETTVGVCMTRTSLGLTIGRPYINCLAYILSNKLSLLPRGVIAELYIGGASLARGYLNQPELTAERFITNPFQNQSGRIQDKDNRLYKTGDLVRYLPDGNIEYIGRNDSQVKIRGFRIELGEIENQLLTYPDVKQAVVLALDSENDDHQYLSGYYVSDKQLDENILLSHLRNRLPEYMLPSLLTYLERFPLSVNGKVDKQKLAKIIRTDTLTYVAPRNELEIKVCDFFAEVLGLSANKIGIYDDFFRLGGSSILLIKLLNKLNNTFNLELDLRAIYENRCLAELCKYIGSQLNNSTNIENIWSF